ncbi:MAG: aminotransferase class I/II-fold pyridoxal phosphate-dependent enzyme, partial [Pseudomonadota bacterium]
MAMDVMNDALAMDASGRRVIHMEVGQPGTPAPEPALQAVAMALQDETLGYTPGLGRADLRAGLSDFYARTYGVEVAAERFVITNGSSAGFILTFLAMLDAGGRLAMTVPGYPCYRQIAAALGIAPVPLRIGPETGWKLTASALAAAQADGGVDALLLASPANPTGTMLAAEELAGIVAQCRAGNTVFISDEIYHGLTYDAPATTALALTDDVIVVNSFSKYFSMTGWRVGWLVVPPTLVATFERLSQHLFICAPNVAQVAACAALGAGDACEAMRAHYAQNRQLILEALPALGFSNFAPADGAFYVFMDVGAQSAARQAAGTRSAQGDPYTSMDWARDLLAEHAVAVTPGLDFDPEHGGDFVRLSYAGPREDVAEGLRRIA